MQLVINEKTVNTSEAQILFPHLRNYFGDPHLSEVILVQNDNVLELKYKNFTAFGIHIDEQVQKHKQYFYKNSPYNELLARAIGLKKDKPTPQVCDASAGLMSDSIMFIALGIKDLSLYERHPLLSELILNAKHRSDYTFEFYPWTQLREQEYEVIYFDPMYDDKNTKSAPKKEMMVLRDIVGEDKDCVAEAKHLFTLAKKRLVIKRPMRSKPLLEGYSHQISGKSTRYDVYMKV